MRFEDLAGRSVVIWGAGREGRAAYAELRRRGVPATIVVTGDATVGPDLASVAVDGESAAKLLTSADVVVKSPGVPHTAAEYLQLRTLGVAVTSLTDLWLNQNRDRVIAVTGTKGKSTTSSLIQHLLVSTGISASLVGNGGVPVTEGDTDGASVAVAEVSSYQAAELSTSPRVAAVTSLYPEHLPWHGSYQQYVADKLNLIAHDPEVVVVPAGAEEISALVAARLRPEASRLLTPESLGISSSATGVRWEGVGVLGPSDIPLRGVHNYANAALALATVAASRHLTVHDPLGLLSSLTSFAPLSHRLETVPSADARTWVDDGLATAPEAVVAALATFPEVPVTLIAGGADRGLSFEPLVAYLAQRSAMVEVLAIGPAGHRLVAEAAGRVPHLRIAADMAAALQLARDDAHGTAVVLLSPGAPSFDEFASYEERSAAFRAAADTI